MVTRLAILATRCSPASLGSMVRVGNVSDVNNMIVTPQFGGSFCFITGVSIDTSNLANETIFIGSDCTQGSLQRRRCHLEDHASASGRRASGSTQRSDSHERHSWWRASWNGARQLDPRIQRTGPYRLRRAHSAGL